MEETTPEQKAYLATFTGRRDAALLEISTLQSRVDSLTSLNKLLAASNTEIQNQVQQSVGRIEELKKQEAELPLLISKEVANLESRKTCLETEIMNLAKIVEILSSQKASLEKDVSSALSAFVAVKDETAILGDVVDHVTKVSTDNARDINMIVADLKKSLEEIIEVNRKNVFETNVVIEKVPAMLVELQKAKLIKNKI
jgi:chromosome segregation ATPase